MSSGNTSNRRGWTGSKKNRAARRGRLNKRLAAYSAMASGVVATTVGTSAQAALVMHDLGDFNVTSPGLEFIDIDGGAVVGSAAGGEVRLYNFVNANGSFRGGIAYADSDFTFPYNNYVAVHGYFTQEWAGETAGDGLAPRRW